MDEKEVSEMQEEMMTVLVVEPMKAPYVKNIPNELEDLQQAQKAIQVIQQVLPLLLEKAHGLVKK